MLKALLKSVVLEVPKECTKSGRTKRPKVLREGQRLGKTETDLGTCVLDVYAKEERRKRKQNNVGRKLIETHQALMFLPS